MKTFCFCSFFLFYLFSFSQINLNKQKLDSIVNSKFKLNKTNIINGTTDISSIISNKFSGVDIKKHNGLLGANSTILIRDLTSLKSNNNPLFIIDGVPLNNLTYPYIKDDISNNFSDLIHINPNNIEEIKIIKSIAKTNIYGSDGRNGVIIINSKLNNDVSRFKIDFSFANYTSTIATLPEYQNEYGQGYNQKYGKYFSNWGPSFKKEGLSGWGNDSTTFDQDGYYSHPYSSHETLCFSYPELCESYQNQNLKWEPNNSVEKFFEIGNTLDASLNIATITKNKKHQLGFHINYLKEKGFTPKNNLKKFDVSFGNTSKINSKITLKSNFNLSNTTVETPLDYLKPNNYNVIAMPYQPTLYESIFSTPRNIDLLNLQYQLENGDNIYYSSTYTHPLWSINNQGLEQKNNRFYGKINVNYKLIKNLTLDYNFNIDKQKEVNNNYSNKGSAGLFREGNYTYSENNNTLINQNLNLQYRKNVNDITYKTNVGLYLKQNKLKQIGEFSSNQIDYGILEHNNFLYHDSFYKKSNQDLFSLFLGVDISYKDLLYVNISGRNEYFKSTYKLNNFMPAIDISYIPINFNTNKYIDFLQLNINYGKTANFNKPRIGESQSSLTTVIENNNLKPEITTEFEYGLQTKLFKKIDLSIKRYNRKLKDFYYPTIIQINEYQSEHYIDNIGKIEFSGTELDLGISIIDKTKFSWYSSINFTKTKSNVLDTDNEELITNSGYYLGNGAKVGYPLGTIFGTSIGRDQNNNILVANNGDYFIDSNVKDIGNPNPDYIVNINNVITFNKISFNFLLNHISGGDIYSKTITTLLARGLTTDTLDRLNTYILPGNNIDTGLPNTIQINNSGYYRNLLAGANELSIYDASMLKLQEIGITYDMSKNIKISLKGYNLWFNAYNLPKGINLDPTTSNASYNNNNNYQGFDFFNGPSAKRFGLRLDFYF